MSDAVELHGTIEDVFGHRFTMKTDAGKTLVDVGPHAEGLDTLKAGASVAVKGEKKPSEVKAKSLKLDDGEWRELAGHKGDKSHDDKSHDHEDHEVSEEDVAKALKEGGYSDPGERVRKPKHIEVVATKDGAQHKVHVHKGGVVKKAEPVS